MISLITVFHNIMNCVCAGAVEIRVPVSGEFLLLVSENAAAPISQFSGDRGSRGISSVHLTPNDHGASMSGAPFKNRLAFFCSSLNLSPKDYKNKQWWDSHF